MWSAWYALTLAGQPDPGPISLDLIQRMVALVTTHLDMVTDGLHASIWTFPAWGGGGEGLTYVQPMTSSYVAVDLWRMHTGPDVAYLQVTSCREFDGAALRQILQDALGLEAVDGITATLRMPSTMDRHLEPRPSGNQDI